MLTCSFNHADMQLSTQGEWHRVHTHMEHKFPPSPWYMIGGHSISFDFMQFVGKFGKIVCSRPLEGWHTRIWEIMDPQLYMLDTKVEICHR